MPRYWKHDTSKPVLELKSVSVAYGEERVLEDISFSVERGERIAVVGPNGAGKSTLFKTIVGILKPDFGNILVYGEKPYNHICIGYVPQASMIDWNFPVSVFDVVMMGRVGKIGLLGRAKRHDRAIVERSLERVGMLGFANKQIGMLSGGQRQRVFLARAIAQEAELLLMDEPLTGLDVTSQMDIYSIIEELSNQGISILVSTHDLNAAGEHFTRIMLLNRRIVKLGSKMEVMKSQYLLETFGGHFTMVEDEHGVAIVGDSCCSGGKIGREDM